MIFGVPYPGQKDVGPEVLRASPTGLTFREFTAGA